MKINKHIIESVTIHLDKCNHMYYVGTFSEFNWSKLKRTNKTIVRSTGYHFGISDQEIYDFLVINPDCYIDNDIVYYYPYISIKMPSGKTYEKWFKKSFDLRKWIDENLTDVELIEL